MSRLTDPLTTFTVPFNIQDGWRKAISTIRSARETAANCLDLSNCGLDRIPGELLEMCSIVELNLEGNQLTSLPKELRNLSKLKIINLSNNNFNSFPEILSCFKELESLDISKNGLSSLPASLGNLMGLKKLYVQENSLSCIPPEIGELSSIWLLNLSSNRLTLLPDSFFLLENLVILQLGNNQISEIPDLLAKLVGLRNIDLQRNLLVKLPDVLCNLNSLRAVNLASNKLSFLPVGFGKLIDLEFLNCWDNLLTELPETIVQLKRLETLILSKNLISHLPEFFGNLGNLRHLSAAHNQLSNLPASFNTLISLRELDLNNNQLVVVPPQIYELVDLEELNLTHNDISCLPDDLFNLASLREFRAWNNLIGILPVDVRKLVCLEVLDLSHNCLTGLPDLENLQRLKTIDVSANAILELPESLGRLPSLEVIRAIDNCLVSLPPSFKLLTSLKILLLSGNDNLRLPGEILGSFNAQNESADLEAARNLLDYYFTRSHRSRPLNEMKLVVVGRGAAGKTSLIKRLVANKYNPDEKETAGIEITRWGVTLGKEEKVRLHAWDFGGQEILHATHQFFFSERCLYLLVLTGRDGQQQADAEYWLQLIGSFGGDSKVIIVLNKSSEHPFDLNRQTLREKYAGRIVAFCETDCCTMIGLDDLRKRIIIQVEDSEHRKVPFPAVWFKIKEVLAKTKSDYYSWDRFSELCGKLGEKNSERQAVLAGYLHALGIALNYSRDVRLADTHVLNPRWVTEGVYAILRAGQFRGSATLDANDLNVILDPKRYPASKHDFLLRLMELYQLCFKLPLDVGKYLIPELLPMDQPDIAGFISRSDISFCYFYSVLPEGILPRFIVQTHALSEGLHRWRSGTMLHWEGCDAVVFSDSVDKVVQIHISGSRGHCRELLAVIRQKFAEQHFSLKAILINEKIPLKGYPGHYADYRDLIKREARKELSFYPENLDAPVNVRDLLDGLETAAVREARLHGGKEQLECESSRVVLINYGQVNQQYGEGKMDNEKSNTMQNISGGTFHNSAVVASAGVFNWQANIAGTQESVIKAQLESLSVLVAQLIQQAPPEIADVANRSMERFTVEALAPVPDREFLTLSAKRLGEAASAVANTAGPILDIVQKIVGLIQ